MSVWDSDRFKKPAKIAIVTLFCIASLITDFPIVGVLAPLFHHFLKDASKVKRYFLLGICYVFIIALSFSSKGWCALGMCLAPLILIYMYNGKSGKKSPVNKWFFYVFFPLHLIILGVLKWFVLGL